MTTERTIHEVARFAEQIARSLNQSAAEFRATLEAGDPQGIGIDRLAGRIEAYEDAAMFVRAQAGRLRADERRQVVDERGARPVKKAPCLYPLPDGRRCLECDACQNPARLNAANAQRPVRLEIVS